MLKPRHTFLDQPALHYKKVVDIGKYLNTTTTYTYSEEIDGEYINYVYVFDKETENFIQIQDPQVWSNLNNNFGVDPLKTYYYKYLYVYNYDVSTHKFIREEYAGQQRDILVIDSNTYQGQKDRYIKNRFFD